jgi:hypothetical protein
MLPLIIITHSFLYKRTLAFLLFQKFSFSSNKTKEETLTSYCEEQKKTGKPFHGRNGERQP